MEDNAGVDGIQFDNTCKKSTCSQGYNKKDKTPEVSKSQYLLTETSHQGPKEEQKLIIDNTNNLNPADCNRSSKVSLESLKNQEEESHVSCVRLEEIVNKRCENYQEENSEMSKNTEEVDTVNCFASSLLTGDQNLLLMSVLKGLNIPYSRTVGPHISHLIVNTTNGCTQNTYKVLYAMALHKPIIRFEWVEHVLRTGGTTVSLVS